MDLNMNLPWQVRITAKIILSRLSLPYSLWHKLSLFRHGSMDIPEYAHSVFQRHFSRYEKHTNKNTKGFSFLELGPGDSLFMSVIAKAYGAKNGYLVDACRAVKNDMQPYYELDKYLFDNGFTSTHDEQLENIKDLLLQNNTQYFTEGLDSLRKIPSESVDFIFSQAVLEHVHRAEFELHINELFRILKKDGLMSHRIDFKDHLGGGINNLRFSSAVWESSFFIKSGFYTNRLRASEVIACLDTAGFDNSLIQIDQFQLKPLAHKKLAAEFRTLSDSDLMISGIDVVSVKKSCIN